MNWFKHAFAVDPPGPAEPTPQQQPVVDRICREIARRHLTTPGLIALEMFRPLNFLGAQALRFLEPAVWSIARAQGFERYQQFALFLERRGSMDYLCRRIEHFEHEYERRERTGADGAGPDAGDGDDAGGAAAEKDALNA
ncbi:MAG: hypothetical protein ACYTGG_08965 [Planctomycetota bacterium]